MLEASGNSLGIVQAIAGMKTKEVTVRGVSNHAGTTPMALRKDPMVAASQVILGLSQAPRQRDLATAVVTVDKASVLPTGSNVIPEQVVFTVDIRDVTEEGIRILEEELERLTGQAMADYGVTITVAELGYSDIIRLSPAVTGIIEQQARARQASYMVMNSGAVHDCAMLAKETEIGMIFVPSVGGISHSPHEYTAFDDIAEGAGLLLDTLLALATS